MVTLYTTHCPKCKSLENILKNKEIEYTISTEISEIMDLGFSTVPILFTNGQYMNYNQAIEWIRERK